MDERLIAFIIEMNLSATEILVIWRNHSPLATLYRYFVVVLVKLPELSDNRVNLFTRLPRLWSCKHVQRIYRSITWYRDSYRDTSARVYILWMWTSVCIVMPTRYRKTAVKNGFWDGRLRPSMDDSLLAIDTSKHINARNQLFARLNIKYDIYYTPDNTVSLL